MNDITPETPVAATPPTPENVAAMLGSHVQRYHDRNDWELRSETLGNMIRVGIEAYPAKAEVSLSEKAFVAVVIESDTDPIVLERPEELGIQWHEGGDLLALTRDGITLFPQGVDEWSMSADNAREMAAHLAAMADAYEAAQAEQGGGAR